MRDVADTDDRGVTVHLPLRYAPSAVLLLQYVYTIPVVVCEAPRLEGGDAREEAASLGLWQRFKEQYLYLTRLLLRLPFPVASTPVALLEACLAHEPPLGVELRPRPGPLHVALLQIGE